MHKYILSIAKAKTTTV